MISNESQVSDLGSLGSLLLFLILLKDPPMAKEIFLSETSLN